MELEWFTIKWVLEQLITKGLPMMAVWWVLEMPAVKKWFDTKVKNFIEAELGIAGPAFKRYVALLLSVVISNLLYLLYANLGYAEVPKGFEQWADLTITLGAINFGGTQILHAAFSLRKNQRNC